MILSQIELLPPLKSLIVKMAIGAGQFKAPISIEDIQKELSSEKDALFTKLIIFESLLTVMRGIFFKDNDVSIDYLELTVRSQNCLRSENIDTIGKLIQCCEMEISEIPTLGRKSLAEIKDALLKYGETFSKTGGYLWQKWREEDERKRQERDK